MALTALLAPACATTPKTPTLLSDVRAQPPRVVTAGQLQTHEVQKGETLYRISKAYGISVEELMDANRIVDPRELKVGEQLYVTGAKEAKAVPAYDSPEPEPQPRPRASKPAVEKKMPRVARVGRGTGSLEWPIRGVLYARFGKKGKEPHDGIDLAAPAGLPVKTAAQGFVLFAGEQKGYGLIVIVEHEKGLVTLYAHNRDLRVKTGQKVRTGQVVATVGDSGRTSGPHLHFEVRQDGIPVDPLDFLGAVPSA